MVDSGFFAKNLQRLMDAKGKTRAEFCTDLGLKYSTVSMWLNENSKAKLPRIESLTRLCEYFGVSLDELIGDSATKPTYNSKLIPLFAGIKCGYPVNFIDGGITDYVECPATIQADFAVKAEGDSMNALGIMDGDTVFIKEQHCFEDGEIMAICIGDSVVLKRCYHFEGGLRMKSENIENKYADQIYSAKQLEDKTAHIIGKLVACQRVF